MIVKNPGPKHPSFRIMKREAGVYRTVQHPDLDLLNKDFQEGRLEPARARQLTEELKRRLERLDNKPITWLPENLAIAESYITEEILPKSNRRPKAATDRIKWGVKQLGKTNLLVSSKAELIAALSHLNVNGQRRAISVLNSLLRFKGSQTKLKRPKRQRREVDYLSLEELKLVTSNLPRKELELICLAAFATGARYGELFAMTLKDLKNGHVWIGGQRLKDWTFEGTKNDKTGDAFVIAEFRDALRNWLMVPIEIKKEMRRREEPGELFKEACNKHLHRPLTFHNLRHSYAHYMLERKATLEDLRQWMRDRLATIEEYYLSWVQTSSQMENNLKRFG